MALHFQLLNPDERSLFLDLSILGTKFAAFHFLWMVFISECFWIRMTFNSALKMFPRPLYSTWTTSLKVEQTWQETNPKEPHEPQHNHDTELQQNDDVELHQNHNTELQHQAKAEQWHRAPLVTELVRPASFNSSCKLERLNWLRLGSDDLWERTTVKKLNQQRVSCENNSDKSFRTKVWPEY